MSEGEEDMDDRLSSPPDGVLSHILSFLPTRICVTTSILSRRWRYLWEYLDVLDLFDDSHVWLQNTQNIMFKYLLERCVLSVLTPSPTLYVPTPSTRGFTPLLGPTSRNSTSPSFHLMKNTNTPSSSHSPSSSLCLTSSPSLSVVLYICKWKTFLRFMGYVDADSLDVVLSGCSVLETLELCFSPQELGKIRIPTSLKRLKVAVENDVGVCLETIHGSDLMYLNLTQVTFSVIGDLQNVMEASLDVFPPQSDSVRH